MERTWEEFEKEWKGLNGKGLKVLSSMINWQFKCQQLSGPHWGILGDSAIPRLCVQKCHVLIYQLENEILKILKEMNTIWMTAHSAINEWIRRQEESSRQITWLDTVGDKMEMVFELYRKEYILKTEMVTLLMTGEDRETSTIYLSAWQMEPCLEKKKREEMHKIMKLYNEII